MPTQPSDGAAGVAPWSAPGTDDPAGLSAIVSNAVADDQYEDDPVVQSLLADIRARHGDGVLAVLMYGSYIRGRRDTLLDFYVLLNSFQSTLHSPWQRIANRVLPPNVYYQHVTPGSVEARAKYSTMTLGQFERALGGDFHAYFWSRFTQPCVLVHSRDAETRARVLRALESAAVTFIDSVLPMLPEQFSARELWQTGFELTYRTELRAETGARIAELYEKNAAHFDALCAGYARVPRSGLMLAGSGTFQRAGPGSPRRAARAWMLRRWQGKLLSALRIIKSAGTFDDPLDYLLWKIGRHSGIYIEPSERQRRFPLIFAWPLLWRLYRLGAFR